MESPGWGEGGWPCQNVAVGEQSGETAGGPGHAGGRGQRWTLNPGPPGPAPTAAAAELWSFQPQSGRPALPCKPAWLAPCSPLPEQSTGACPWTDHGHLLTAPLSHPPHLCRGPGLCQQEETRRPPDFRGPGSVVGGKQAGGQWRVPRRDAPTPHLPPRSLGGTNSSVLASPGGRQHQAGSQCPGAPGSGLSRGAAVSQVPGGGPAQASVPLDPVRPPSQEWGGHHPRLCAWGLAAQQDCRTWPTATASSRPLQGSWARVPLPSIRQHHPECLALVPASPTPCPSPRPLSHTESPGSCGP